MAGPGDVTFFTDLATQNYVSEITATTIMKTAGPMMLGLVVLEALLSLFTLQKTHRLNDAINSMSHGFIERAWSRLTSKTLEFGVYCYIYAHWAPYHFDENVWTGIIAFIGVDCGYYWFHRMAHEINLFWGTHSVHHSSEEYNLSTAMRQSVVQTYCSWMFYLPLALIVPPRLFYVHLQVNLIYQFFIHTKMIGNMGVLEWVLNTPSHHRVHHGRNPRYLDRNYGGVLIIFDRLFGTFQEEDEEVYYGLVHTSQTFDLFQGQFAHFIYMYGRIKEERGWWNKWAVVWKGPGWRAGAPRMGFASDVPEIDPNQPKYDPKMPRGHWWYLLINFVSITVFVCFVNMGLLQTRSHTVLTPKTEIIEDNIKGLQLEQEGVMSFEDEIYLQPDGGVFLLPSYFWHAVLIGLFTFSLECFALISDRWRWAEHFEAARCAFFLALDLLCYATSAPGEHRIFWYTDPARRFTAWSLGFMLLRLDLAVSFLYMAWHIYISTRTPNILYPTPPPKEQVSTAANDRLEQIEQEKMQRKQGDIISPVAVSSKSSTAKKRRKLKSSDQNIPKDHPIDKMNDEVDEKLKEKENEKTNDLNLDINTLKDNITANQREESSSPVSSLSASSSPSAGGERLSSLSPESFVRSNDGAAPERDSTLSPISSLLQHPTITTITTTEAGDGSKRVDILSEEAPISLSSSGHLGPSPLSSSFDLISKAGALVSSPQTTAKSRSNNNKPTRAAYSSVGAAI